MIYIFLAEGFEEVEALAPLDILRRADIPVVTVGVGSEEITGSHNISVKADISLDEVEIEDIDGVILPGGMPGTLNLQADAKVMEYVKYAYDNNKLLGAICAAPMILGELGYLSGIEAICFPGFEEHLKGASISEKGVACVNNIITAKGAGVALQFGGAIANYFKEGKGDEILAQMQYNG